VREERTHLKKPKRDGSQRPSRVGRGVATLLGQISATSGPTARDHDSPA